MLEIPAFMLEHAKEKTIELVCECIKKELEGTNLEATKTNDRFDVLREMCGAGREHAIAP